MMTSWWRVAPRLIFRSTDKRYVSVSFFGRQRSLVYELIDVSNELATEFLCYLRFVTCVSHVVSPAIFSANGYDGVPCWSNFHKVLTYWKSCTPFFFFFRSLTAWFEILADNVLSIYWYLLTPDTEWEWLQPCCQLNDCSFNVDERVVLSLLLSLSFSW